MTPEQLEYFEKNGYVIVEDLIPKEIFEPLAQAADKVTDLARNGEWDFVRVVGQMFPPWKRENLDDIWGVQHLMNPKLGQKVFAEWYGSEGLLSFVQHLMGCKEEELQLELFNLLVNPNKTRYEIAWHRDAIPLETPEALEAELLKINHYGCQWNTALYEDSSLIVIPASHKRPRTPEERKMIFENLNCVLPNQLIVNLKPGQTVFYNNNILHRAVYPLDSERKRRTLHACIGQTVGGTKRADNLFQHNLSWLKNIEEVQKALPPRLIPLHERLLVLAEQEEKRKVVLKKEKKLNWGIIGTGKIAYKFIKSLLEAKSQKHRVIAIASSSDLKKAQKLRAQFPGLENVCYCYGSYPELCADQNVDVVYVATPHTLHCSNSLLALRMSKKVLVEKPFAINTKEAEMMISIAKENGLFIMEAMWTRFLPVANIILEHLSKIGPIHMIQGEFCMNFGITDVKSRVLDPALGGGALNDLGIYPITWATFLIYKISGKLVEPKITSIVTKSPQTNVDETTTIILNYEAEKVQAVLTSSMVFETPSQLKIFGSNGNIILSGHQLTNPKKIEVQIGKEVSIINLEVEGLGYIYEADHVEECLEKGLKESFVMGFKETLLNVKIMEEVRKTHGIVFPGDH